MHSVGAVLVMEMNRRKEGQADAMAADHTNTH